MKKFAALLLFAVLILSACGQKNAVAPAPGAKQADLKKTTAETGKVKSAGIADICNYFPKELVESAIGKPIVKIETGTLTDPTCNYYTSYSETYDHTPYGDKPGGPHVVVVYDTKDFVKDKAYNETHGTVYESDQSVGMDNFVMRNTAKKIWQTALVLGDDKYLRIKFVDDAVTGDDLVKIAKKFAEKIESGK
jgi:hypothetical protein